MSGQTGGRPAPLAIGACPGRLPQTDAPATLVQRVVYTGSSRPLTATAVRRPVCSRVVCSRVASRSDSDGAGASEIAPLGAVRQPMKMTWRGKHQPGHRSVPLWPSAASIGVVESAGRSRVASPKPGPGTRKIATSVTRPTRSSATERDRALIRARSRERPCRSTPDARPGGARLRPGRGRRRGGRRA